MNRQKWTLLIVALALIGGTAVFLGRVSASQKLAVPGIKTHASDEPGRLEIDLPVQVLDCRSELIPVDKITKDVLPPDTSFGERRYDAPDGFWMMLNVVLMGTDRTSLHKPQFCLAGQGWRIDAGGDLATSVRLKEPAGYELPVVRLLASREMTAEGQAQTVRAVYVYWFIADDAVSASVSGFERMWMMGSKLLRTGVLQRWAYVSCLSVCQPGQEEATFERMKRLIADAAPQFQLYPKTQRASAETARTF